MITKVIFHKPNMCVLALYTCLSTSWLVMCYTQLTNMKSSLMNKTFPLGAEIPMELNSAYVIPPPRLKLKVMKNEAYSSVAPQHLNA